MSILTSCIRGDAEYLQLVRTAERDFRAEKPLPILASGLCEGASDAFLVSFLGDIGKCRGNRPVLILCSEEKDCIKVCNRLGQNGFRVGFYMARDFNFYDVNSSHEYEHERLSVLTGLLDRNYDAVVTTPDAAIEMTIPPERLEARLISLDADTTVDPRTFAARLCDAGYVRSDLTERPGQFSVRGDIIDIYPPYGSFTDSDGGERRGEYALRVELFGDEIDRVGLFDPNTQRTTETVKSAIFAPSREVLPDAEGYDRVLRAITAQISLAEEPSAVDELQKEKSAVQTARDGGLVPKFADKYLPQIYPETASLIDYFDGRSFVLFRGTNAAEGRLRVFKERLNQTVSDLVDSGVLAKKNLGYVASQEAWGDFLGRNVTVHVDSIAHAVSDRQLAGLFGFRTRHTVNYSENEELFLEDLQNYITGGYRCIVLTENPAAASAMTEKLKDDGYVVLPEPPEGTPMEAGTVTVLAGSAVGTLAGYELLSPRCVVLSFGGENRAGALSLSGKSGLKPKRRKDTKNILSYTELEEGDYVVHEKYGIGQYTGISTITSAGITRDYIGIRYADNGKLFLPVETLDSVSKYIGAHADDGTVKLSKMGGESWNRSKTRAKAAVREMAKELIQLYAERLRRPGHAFQADDSYQKAFEDAFEYDETESQLTTSDEIKADMMRANPMDRLLCGDVGYGKTEVALRAAYKAVLGGKQVAILVPTTLLALQHYQTIVSRMRPFAVKVGMISRFRTAKQQTQTLKELARGDIDIIVGTHRLLSKDIQFHDLGLLVIDEEQRFGVAQKEKLKKVATGVDVLSLSATPIPRSLNMAMGGMRDISILDDAPVDRLPVQTYVLEKDDLIINDAIRRELRRGGQVYYLFNNVEGIDTVAANLSESFPEARITVAHGKMEKEDLESIWEKMSQGEIDILVCTTIIETGVDIPNANTLVVENAHRLGLSQLHQIRGRIGRSSRRAYAYFTYPPYKSIPEVAQKRLEAIREYAEFGAGFKIAVRDMEIRGAGDLLGARQHGHLDAVGYDLYIKLLNRAVLSEQGKTPEEETRECTVSLSFDAFLPERYVPYPAQRMSLYKRIALISSEEDLSDMIDELTDRFGDVPAQTMNLLKIALIHSDAVGCGMTSIRQDASGVHLVPATFEVDVWTKLSALFPNRLRVLMSADPHIVFRPQKTDDLLETLHRILAECLKIQKQKEGKPQ